MKKSSKKEPVLNQKGVLELLAGWDMARDFLMEGILIGHIDISSKKSLIESLATYVEVQKRHLKALPENRASRPSRSNASVFETREDAMTVYQIKITIDDIKPPIWRRLLIPSEITFHKLHAMLQAAFGWQNYHLYNFEIRNCVMAIPDPDYGPGELYGKKEELNAKKERLSGYLEEKTQFTYTYDFGDKWVHSIVMEKRLAAEETRKYPFCLEGARHRPPEDVGGTYGYKEFLKAIATPTHPEHEAYLLWAEKDTGGKRFDPEYFPLNAINRALARIR